MDLKDHFATKPGQCVVCGCSCLPPHLTDSPECHEHLVADLEREFGTHKRVTRMTTGQSFAVPVRDIVEIGVKEEDLDKYPPWKEADHER